MKKYIKVNQAYPTGMYTYLNKNTSAITLHHIYLNPYRNHVGFKMAQS